MRSSRRDGFTQCVLPFVLPFVRFLLLVSLKFYLVLKSFNGVLRKFKGCFKEVSWKLQECFEEVSEKFERSFNKVSWVFQVRL